ncbi:IclR family transcriptional regulator [Burkholderiaceae bacterium FT117]|uniref:IclR family transcriptional regulator n=1 Tax=Zeimonas sediminis TaxID=2944268 RepID=UPI0023431105|nr:IclR family transcriptional regulator [Zeimonas sediminis]MCM5570471.1 IclR family transcriptional regulator [Zeimonas sediminis]
MEKSLVKSLRVMEMLALSEAPRGVSDLARDLGYQKSNVHRILTTLVDQGYVVRFDVGPVYQLNYKMFEIGSRVVSRLRLSEVARPFLQRIVRATGESAHIMIYHNAEIIYLDKIENNAPIRASSEPGLRAPAYCVASGKALLAYQPDDEVRRVLRRVKTHTPSTITDPDRLRDEIQAVHASGYAINRDGWREGVSGAAAPVLVGRSHAIAALAILGPSDRMTEARLHDAGKFLSGIAKELSRKLGYDPDGTGLG